MSDYFKNLLINIPEKPIDLVRVHVFPSSHLFNTDIINNALSDWDKLGKCGAFCKVEEVPEESTTSIEFSDLKQELDYVWTIHMRNCDRRCLMVLACLVIDAGYFWNPEQEIVESLYKKIIISDTSNDQKVPLFDLKSVGFRIKDYQYPQVVEILKPLVVFKETTSPRAFRRAIIELYNYTAESFFDQINEKIIMWREVVENSYPHMIEDIFTGDGAIKGISVDIFDERSLELKIETFGGSEAAWNSLVNLLGTLRHVIHYIKIY